MGLFHKHKWKVLHEKRIPCLAEEAKKIGYFNDTRLSVRNFIVGHVTILVCEDCGKLYESFHQTEC